MAVVERRLGPIMQKLFPSFIYTHYAYITFFVIIGSILIYPQKNIRYIDALFFAAGASTQAGLNPIDVNELTLFQQMVIYVVCCLTTPIFIHGGILLLRLYWFERYFDDIKTTSKLNHKMRRTATLLAIRSQQSNQTFDRSGTANSRNSARDHAAVVSGTEFYDYLHQPLLMQRSSSSPETTKEASSTESSNRNNDVELDDMEPMTAARRVISRVDSDVALNDHHDVPHYSEPSDSDNEKQQISPEERLKQGNNEGEIKFVENLPRPMRRKKDIEPQDMYMSIAMMQNNHKLQHPGDDDQEDGPALVIKGPLEREKMKKRKLGHRRRHHKRPYIKKFRYDQNFDENFDDVEMKSMGKRKSFLQFRVPSSVAKVRSRSGGSKPWRNLTKDQHNNEEAVIDDDDDVSINSNNIADDSANEEDLGISKAQTNLAIPSSDRTGGLKYSKRANTLDVNPMRRPSIIGNSPTFDNFFKRRNSRKHKSIHRYSSSVVDDDDDDDDEGDDDEEMSNVGLTTSPNGVSGNYLSWTPTVARNSTFVALTDDQKEELGGVEYRAVKLLCKIVVVYYIGFHIIAMIFFLPYVIKKKNYAEAMREYGFSPAWWGFFTSMSVFNDLGYTLTPNSMFLFYKNPYILLLSGFFIIIGNTGFPIFLRFLIWIMFKISKPLSLFKESLGFLLDHPRRCFTLLFPSVPTWWLFFILIVLNAIDLVLFIILDLSNSSLTSIPRGYRVLDGLFQAFSTRTAGFAVVDLSKLHPSVQVSYMLMMYISVLPLAISIRRTNVYEEQSLGIYSLNGEEGDDSTPKNFIATHLRNQLSFDLWFIFLGLFIICIADGGKLQKNNVNFSVFQVLFEIVSAYGTVGLSLGYPNTNTSFSAQFSTISKLVIIAMMIRGRHRGLPYALDRAIILPSEKMRMIDQMQERYNYSRENTMNTTDSRTRTNIFNRVKTLRSGFFNVGATFNQENWIDSRVPRKRRETHSHHQPENITFSLGRPNVRDQGLQANNAPIGDDDDDDIDSLDSQGQDTDEEGDQVDVRRTASEVPTVNSRGSLYHSQLRPATMITRQESI